MVHHGRAAIVLCLVFGLVVDPWSGSFPFPHRKISPRFNEFLIHALAPDVLFHSLRPLLPDQKKSQVIQSMPFFDFPKGFVPWSTIERYIADLQNGNVAAEAIFAIFRFSPAIGLTRPSNLFELIRLILTLRSDPDYYDDVVAVWEGDGFRVTRTQNIYSVREARAVPEPDGKARPRLVTIDGRPIEVRFSQSIYGTFQGDKGQKLMREWYDYFAGYARLSPLRWSSRPKKLTHRLGDLDLYERRSPNGERFVFCLEPAVPRITMVHYDPTKVSGQRGLQERFDRNVRAAFDHLLDPGAIKDATRIRELENAFYVEVSRGLISENDFDLIRQSLNTFFFDRVKSARRLRELLRNGGESLETLQKELRELEMGSPPRPLVWLMVAWMQDVLSNGNGAGPTLTQAAISLIGDNAHTSAAAALLERWTESSRRLLGFVDQELHHEHPDWEAIGALFDQFARNGLRAEIRKTIEQWVSKQPIAPDSAQLISEMYNSLRSGAIEDLFKSDMVESRIRECEEAQAVNPAPSPVRKRSAKPPTSNQPPVSIPAQTTLPSPSSISEDIFAARKLQDVRRRQALTRLRELPVDAVVLEVLSRTLQTNSSLHVFGVSQETLHASAALISSSLPHDEKVNTLSLLLGFQHAKSDHLLRQIEIRRERAPLRRGSSEKVRLQNLVVGPVTSFREPELGFRRILSDEAIEAIGDRLQEIGLGRFWSHGVSFVRTSANLSISVSTVQLPGSIGERYGTEQLFHGIILVIPDLEEGRFSDAVRWANQWFATREGVSHLSPSRDLKEVVTTIQEIWARRRLLKMSPADLQRLYAETVFVHVGEGVWSFLLDQSAYDPNAEELVQWWKQHHADDRNSLIYARAYIREAEFADHSLVSQMFGGTFAVFANPDSVWKSWGESISVEKRSFMERVMVCMQNSMAGIVPDSKDRSATLQNKLSDWRETWAQSRTGQIYDLRRRGFSDRRIAFSVGFYDELRASMTASALSLLFLSFAPALWAQGLGAISGLGVFLSAHRDIRYRMTLQGELSESSPEEKVKDMLILTVVGSLFRLFMLSLIRNGPEVWWWGMIVGLLVPLTHAGLYNLLLAPLLNLPLGMSSGTPRHHRAIVANA